LADTARGIARTLAACTQDEWRRLWEIVQHADVRQGSMTGPSCAAGTRCSSP
jgi:hypothetical protein